MPPRRNRGGGLPPAYMLEKEWQRQVLDLAIMYGWHLAKKDVPQDEPDFVLPGIAWHPTLAMRSERGWPDLTLVRNRGPHVRLLFAELKTDSPGSKLTPRQHQVLGLLRCLAGTWHRYDEGGDRADQLTIDIEVWRPRDVQRVAEVLR